MPGHGQPRIVAERDDEAGMIGLKVGRGDDHRADLPGLQLGEGSSQIGLRMHIALDQGETEAGCRLARKRHLVCRVGIVVVRQHQNALKPRVDLLQQLEPLAYQCQVGQNTGEISAGVREALDVTAHERVVDVYEYDWNLLCRRAGSANALVLERYDHIDTRGHPRLDRRRSALRVALISPVEAKVLAIHIAHIVERLVQRIQAGRFMIEPDMAERHVPDLCRLLRESSRRRGGQAEGGNAEKALLRANSWFHSFL
jgi:hypothetical protein